MVTRVSSVALLLVVAFSALCQGQENAGWQTLAPDSVELPGTTLHYEKALAEHVEAFRTIYGQFRAERARIQAECQALLKQRDEVVAEIDRIVGLAANDTQRANQGGDLARIATSLSLMDLARDARFVLLQRETTKNYLRHGGSLPGFTYDRATDTVSYRLEFGGPAGENGGTGSHEIFLPVESPESAEKEFRQFLSALAKVGTSKTESVGGAIHEIVEAAILIRLKPKDPNFRWFTDGFSNAITTRLLRTYVGEEAANEYADLHDTTRYADLEKELNLYYWMGIGYCIETPLESEEDLTLARYAYATAEANHLIEAHGLECVKRVLDEVATGRPTRAQDLLAAVEKATGENIRDRLRHYGPFPSKAEAIARYTEQFQAAASRKDYAAILPPLSRLLELKGIELADDLRCYAIAAVALFHMGHEDMGDRSILGPADQYQSIGSNMGYIVLHEMYIGYARTCSNLAKARPSAEIVLKTEPDFAPALAIMMDKANEEGDKEKAHALARRVLELEKDPENPWRQLAEAALPAARGN